MKAKEDIDVLSQEDRDKIISFIKYKKGEAYLLIPCYNSLLVAEAEIKEKDRQIKAFNEVIIDAGTKIAALKESSRKKELELLGAIEKIEKKVEEIIKKS